MEQRQQLCLELTLPSCTGLSHKKTDLGLFFPLPQGYFKTCSPSLPQQNEIQLIQLKQFWEQLLKACNVR